MTKEELIKENEQLKIKLSNSKGEIQNILNIANNLLIPQSKPLSFEYYDSNQYKITNGNELFYEIGKLKEFKENILEERGYKRQQNNNKNRILQLEEQLRKFNNNK